MTKVNTCGTPGAENNILDVLIHIFILASILSVFFLFVIVPIEKNELNNQVNSNIEDGLKTIMQQIKKSGLIAKSDTKEFLNRIQTYYSGESEVNNTYNEGIISSLLIVLGFILFSIVSVYLIYKQSCGRCPHIGSLIGENILLFLIIGIIEYIFFIKIASTYIPVKPTLIKETVNEYI